MEIFLLVVGWLLVGCGVAWMIGSAASMSDATVGKHAPQNDADANIEHFWDGEHAPDEAAGVATGTDRRQLRSI
jgi:hypothetical protein